VHGGAERERNKAMTEHGRASEHLERSPRRVGLSARVLMVFVRIYQATLSPLLGGYCRFQPTCSNYALTALTEHGAVRGGWMTLRRLLRCHPFGGAGWDPVPPRSCDDEQRDGAE